MSGCRQRLGSDGADEPDLYVPAPITSPRADPAASGFHPEIGLHRDPVIREQRPEGAPRLVAALRSRSIRIVAHDDRRQTREVPSRDAGGEAVESVVVVANP